jgi:hypothetical protein
VKKKEERKEKGKNWYGITSMGQHTERVKPILRREGFNVFRKEGEKIEWKVKKKKSGKEKGKRMTKRRRNSLSNKM